MDPTHRVGPVATGRRTMIVSLDAAIGAALDPAWETNHAAVLAAFGDKIQAAHSEIEGAFGNAGFYGGDAAPYAPPTIPADAPPAAHPTVVTATRRLWMARYNPHDGAWRDNDVADETHFPWAHPEMAPTKLWWLSTINTWDNRAAIAEIAVGDLVVVQRSAPADRSELYGICVVGMKTSFTDEDGYRHHEGCLIPLRRFDHPVPRKTARQKGRLRGKSFEHIPQLPGGGQPGRTLSYLELDAAVELLSVCGISPEVLAEPDNAVLAARLANTATGNKEFFDLRYDAVARNDERRAHEREAEQRAQQWAAARGFALLDEYQRVPLSGFDLLFQDGAGQRLELEIKGYSSQQLARVHLQPSQAQRAQRAAGGQPPDWRLFAVLGAGTPTPTDRVVDPHETIALLDSGGLQVKGGWPLPVA
ncbi:MAG TPA: hypothetical protein VHD87_15520 [Acidimicrobiales bacterium]|nr:hypothetical protein [Acidimicrobiales bacterium]